jgi:predicted ATPase
MPTTLEKLTLKGFKTIRELVDFEPGPLTVLIGPNGAGKSNFISFFHLLSSVVACPGALQEYVARGGGASAILHDGPGRTREIAVEVTVVTPEGENAYGFRLLYAAGDTLAFVGEKYGHFRADLFDIGGVDGWPPLHPEAKLAGEAETGNLAAKATLGLLRKSLPHHFHDTSDTSRMRQKWNEDDNRRLKEDGGNMAPFLWRLRDREPKCYQRIVETVRLILPFFADFDLEPEYGKLLLRWRERGSDLVFNASQAGDGMLRAMALVALLLQPERDFPNVLILDEPELGLHPYAIKVVAGLIQSAATKTQVVVATQSTRLVDCFEPEDIVVVERRERESVFKRLNGDDLREWLEEYSLSELWEKNVIGGRP